MKYFETSNGKNEAEILFSKAVKAGKRIYYIDVKRDRHEELYLSITESKRVKDGTEEVRPVFEKHKIFLYREDLEKFIEAFEDAAHFAIEKQPTSMRQQRTNVPAEEVAPVVQEDGAFGDGEIKLGEIEF
jgi:hypothetical protein